MERRKFIRDGCGYCAAIAVAGTLGVLLDGCKPSDLIYKTENVNGMLKIPAEKISGKKILVVRSSGLEYDLLLVRENENQFHALPMQCTHRQQPLVATTTGLICNEHGSRFDLEGHVTRDPATVPLQKLKAEAMGNEIVIHVG